MESKVTILVIAAVALACSFTQAYDPSPLQNICVAAPNNLASGFVNGKFCKDPSTVTLEDFVVSAGLQNRGNTSNPLGFAPNIVDINRLPGLNTQGISVIRSDLAPNGIIPLHIHPRATEIVILLEGTVYAGFVNSISTPGSKSKLFAKILNPGDVIVFPIGMMHFIFNIGNTSAAGLAAFNSQESGFIKIPGDLFGTDPPISTDLLAKGFQLDKKQVEHLQSLRW